MNPLLQFDAPRRFANAPENGGSEVLATSRVTLGEGLVATLSPAAPAPGEVQTMGLATTGPSAASFAALDGRVTALENGRLVGTSTKTPIADGESYGAAYGNFVRIDLQNLGGGEAFSVNLPEVTAVDAAAGRRIGVREVWGTPDLGGPGPDLYINGFGGQEFDKVGGGTSMQLTGQYPVIVLLAVELSPGVYGWTIESRNQQ